jgi:hypothetical protein
MKTKLLLLVIFILPVTLVRAQISTTVVNCSTPMSNTFFQQKLNQVNATYDAVSRMNQARALVQNNCLSSWQVKQVAMALYDDSDKLEFCKMAFPKTTDPDNFYDVYDAFAYFSTAFRLHDFVQNTRNGGPIRNNPPVTQNDMFPVLPYPDYNQYLGPTGCSLPISEEAFMGYVREMKGVRMTDQARFDYAKNIIATQCLSTAQIMKMGTLITLENLRLDLLKAGLPRVYDRGNYGSGQYILSTQAFKNDFMNALYGQPNNTNNQNTPPPCTVSQTDFDDIKRSINNASFASSKVTIGKQAIQAKKCFTVKQIKEILGLFAFDENKLDMAKFCYDYCIDKSNYYQVNDVFSFSSSKDELSTYVQSRQ